MPEEWGPGEPEGKSPTRLHPIPKETAQISHLRAGEGHSPVSNRERDKKDGESLPPTFALTSHSALGASTLICPLFTGESAEVMKPEHGHVARKLAEAEMAPAASSSTARAQPLSKPHRLCR